MKAAQESSPAEAVDLNEFPAANRERARHAIDVLSNLTNTAIGAQSSITLWLMASLLSLNAGGIVALIDLQPSSSPVAVGSGGAFAAGIVSALLVGVALQIVHRKGMAAVGELLAYWVEVSVNGYRDKETETELIGNVAAFESGWRLYLSSGLGVVSMLFFLAGTATLMIGTDFGAAKPAGL